MAKKVILSGDIGLDITVQGVADELKAANGGDIDFFFSSRGGFVFAGIEMFNLIRNHKGHTRMIVTGIAASMGTYVALSANEVIALSNTSWMIHNALALVLGNHNDMRKRADSLESMSDILAKEYAKKTGKPFAEIKALMDDETFLFGDEISNAGFVDEIREAGEEDGEIDRAAALITSRSSVEACMTRLRDTEAANEDFSRAVAYIDGMSALMDPPKPKIEPAAASGDNIDDPAGAGNKNQEDKHMTLEALLADPANASARAEFELALTKARTEGETAAKDEMKAVIAKVSPILTSADYDEKVKAFGAEVITGDKTLDGFEAIVFMADQKAEEVKAALAKAESEAAGETPPAGGGDGKDAEAKAKFDEKFARSGKGV